MHRGIKKAPAFLYRGLPRKLSSWHRRAHHRGGYGAGTLNMGAVAPVIISVLATPVWIRFFNV
jgi:hypothetical protein